MAQEEHTFNLNSLTWPCKPQRTYLQMNQQEVDQCEKLRNSYFWPGNLPVYEVSTFKTCEKVLLNDSTAESLRTCEVQVSYKKTPLIQIYRISRRLDILFLGRSLSQYSVPYQANNQSATIRDWNTANCARMPPED